MPRFGMVIDLAKCSGCQACVVACRVENNVPFAGPEEAAMGRAITWIDVVALADGEPGRGKMRLLPTLCMHCDNPPCTRVCPVGATTQDADGGFVSQIYSRCIGCRYCTNACPYTVKYFNWGEPAWPEEMRASLNPDVSVRRMGVVEKCSFCHHRYQKAKDRVRAEGRELRDGDYVPACVESCPTGAMVFGDLDDPGSEVARLARSGRAFRLQEELGTEPKVYYLREEAAHED